MTTILKWLEWLDVGPTGNRWAMYLIIKMTVHLDRKEGNSDYANTKDVLELYLDWVEKWGKE